jgi:hypothetical protein
MMKSQNRKGVFEMKWIIDGEEYTSAREAADYIMENCDDDAYDEMLDECYGEIEICGLSYSASIALYRVDEIAYNCGRNDWADSEAGNIADELEGMDGGDTNEFYGYEVEAIDDEDEDEEDEEDEF